MIVEQFLSELRRLGFEFVGSGGGLGHFGLTANGWEIVVTDGDCYTDFDGEVIVGIGPDDTADDLEQTLHDGTNGVGAYDSAIAQIRRVLGEKGGAR